MSRVPALAALLAVLGCTPTEAPPPVVPDVPAEEPIEEPEVTITEVPELSDSGTFLFRQDGKGMIVVDPDTDGLLLFRRSPSSGRTMPLAGEPTRMQRVGERFFVTLRLSGELVELHAPGSEDPTEVRRVSVGSEPFDVVVSEDGTRLYVSLSLENAVVELDIETLEVLNRWDVDFEPRWMDAALNADGEPRIYVASFRDPRITEIVPSTGDTIVHPLPLMPRFDDPVCGDQTLGMRITGDIKVSDDGEAIWIPALYADPALAVVDVEVDESFDTGIPLLDPCSDAIVFDSVPVGPWAVPVRVAEAARVGQFNASLVRLSVTEGTPHDVQAVGVSSYPNGIANNNNVAAMRSYPSSLTIVQVGEKDRIAWVAMEASDTIVAIDLDKPTDEESGAFSTYERTGFDVPDGPRDVRVAPDGAPEVWLWSWLDRELVSYPVGAVNQAIRETIPQTFTPTLTNRAPEPTTISEDAQAGRRFFYAANNERVMARSAGVSCSSCHPDGRSDGFSWFSEGILRQAPSLHGTVSTTGPFGWDGQVPSAKHEVTTTTTTRTGGTGLNDAEASQLVAFLDSTRDIVPPTVRNDEERALVELGREVFSREEVGCAECHNGEQGSDGENHEVFGRVVNTPRLKGIAGSAPYFRDGSAYTLAEVLERVTDGSMGDTSSLTEHEMEALEAYLLRF